MYFCVLDVLLTSCVLLRLTWGSYTAYLLYTTFVLLYATYYLRATPITCDILPVCHTCMQHLCPTTTGGRSYQSNLYSREYAWTIPLGGWTIAIGGNAGAYQSHTYTHNHMGGMEEGISIEGIVCLTMTMGGRMGVLEHIQSQCNQ